MVLRLIATTGRPTLYLDFDHTMGTRDCEFAGYFNRDLLLHMRPTHIEEGTDAAIRFINEIPECIIAIDPLSAACGMKYEIGSKQGGLRSQLRFLNLLQPHLIKSNGSMVIVDHSFSDDMAPVISLFANHLIITNGFIGNDIKFTIDAKLLVARL